MVYIIAATGARTTTPYRVCKLISAWEVYHHFYTAGMARRMLYTINMYDVLYGMQLFDLGST